MDTCCVKQSDSPSTLHTHWEEPDQRNTGNSTNYCDTPKYVVVDVLGRAVSKTYRRLPESRYHRHIITLLRAQVATAEAAGKFCSEVRYCR